MSGQKRAAKVGIAYEVEKKLEQNWDREEAAGVPQAIRQWMNGVVGSEHDPIPEGDWKVMNQHLKDGVMLCKLINKLLKQDGKPPISFQKKVMSPFVAMTNIENFNKGCMAYGLPEESTFQSGELTDEKKAGMIVVIQTTEQVATIANNKDVTPLYEGKSTKKE